MEPQSQSKSRVSYQLKAAKKRRDYLVGTALLCGVIFLWVSSSFMMNSMFTDMSYNKPFLITYLCTATFSLYLIGPAISQLRLARRRRAGKEGYSPLKTDGLLPGEEDLEPAPPAPRRSSEVLDRSQSRSRALSESLATSPVTASPDAPLTTSQTASLALLFCGIWFIANWSVNAALGYTSVSSTTILSSMSGFFTLLVGASVGVDDINATKLLSVAISVIGVVVVSKGDRDLSSAPSEGSDPRLPSAPLLGDALALGSALAYAFYVILLKVRIKNENRVSMTLFFGFVGLFNIFLIWPVGFVLHFTQIEVWEWPHGGKLWTSIAINAAITFVSDALYLKAMLMTSPLAVTLGISLTIPLAVAGDVLRGTELGGWKVYLGGALVLGGFLANGLMDLNSTDKEDEDVSSSRGSSRGRSRRPSTEVLLRPTSIYSSIDDSP